jgi:hypothetical protein
MANEKGNIVLVKFAEVRARTAKAILARDYTSSECVWMPIKLVWERMDRSSKGHAMVAAMPEWLAKEKGFTYKVLDNSERKPKYVEHVPVAESVEGAESSAQEVKRELAENAN